MTIDKLLIWNSKLHWVVVKKSKSWEREIEKNRIRWKEERAAVEKWVDAADFSRLRSIKDDDLPRRKHAILWGLAQPRRARAWRDTGSASGSTSKHRDYYSYFPSKILFFLPFSIRIFREISFPLRDVFVISFGRCIGKFSFPISLNRHTDERSIFPRRIIIKLIRILIGIVVENLRSNFLFRSEKGCGLNNTQNLDYPF